MRCPVLFLVAVLAVMFLGQLVWAGVTVTPFKEAIMFFEPLGELKLYTDYWTVVTEFKPTNVSELVDIAEALLREEKAMCDDVEKKTRARCKLPFEETAGIIQILRKGQETLNSFSRKRNRRAIEFVGDALNYMFGTVSANGAREISEKIAGVKENEARTFDLLNKQVTVLRRSFDTLAKPIEGMTREVNGLRDYLNTEMPAIEGEIKRGSGRVSILEFKVEMLERLTRVNANLFEAQSIQSRDISIIDDLIKNKLHPTVLSEKDIRDLTSKLPDRIQNSWITGSPMLALSTATVRTFPMKTGIRIIVKIPIPEQEVHELHAVYALPVTLNTGWDAVTRLGSKFLVTGREANVTRGFAEKNYGECITVGGQNMTDTRICRDPVGDDNSENTECEINMFLNVANGSNHCHVYAIPHVETRLIRTVGGAWLYKFDTEQLFRMSCGGKFEALRLNGWGRLDMGEGCIMLGDNINITHRPSVISKMEQRPFHIRSSALFEKFKRIKPMFDTNDTFLHRLPEAAIAEHSNLHKSLQEGKREIEDLVSDINRNRNMRTLEQGQLELRTLGYSLWGGSGTVIVIIGIVLVVMCRRIRLTQASSELSRVVTSQVAAVISAPAIVPILQQEQSLPSAPIVMPTPPQPMRIAPTLIPPPPPPVAPRLDRQQPAEYTGRSLPSPPILAPRMRNVSNSDEVADSRRVEVSPGHVRRLREVLHPALAM